MPVKDAVFDGQQDHYAAMQPQGPYAAAPQRPANTETYPIKKKGADSFRIVELKFDDMFRLQLLAPPTPRIYWNPLQCFQQLHGKKLETNNRSQ